MFLSIFARKKKLKVTNMMTEDTHRLFFKQRNVHLSDDNTVAAQLNTKALYPVLTLWHQSQL
jgi:hypothetical protein